MTEIIECVELLRQMVAIPSESGHEAALAAFIETFLREELGMQTQPPRPAFLAPPSAA